MKPVALALLFATLTLSAPAQAPQSLNSLAPILSFEAPQPVDMPRGWGGGPAGTIFVDNKIVHGGQWSARLELDAASSDGASRLIAYIPADFAGSRIEWRGYLKTQDVSGFAGLWLREDGDAPSLAFDNMERLRLNGTHDWAEYSVNLPFHPKAKQLFFGVLMAGTGKVWVDDLQLLVDGKPVWDAPKLERKKTPLDTDHEFDAGSGITISDLTKTQIENLALLGKVWGFLKYHHPSVVAGERHWDYELFRVAPKILAAETRATARTALNEWIRGLGNIPACTNCIAPASGSSVQQASPVAWINQESELGSDLSNTLSRIYRSRSPQPHFYVSTTQYTGNPYFDHEPSYLNIRFPDAGYQLLALYRYWNMVEYWYPNRDILDQDWNQVLTDFVPRMMLANSRDAYQLEATQLIGKITDTHANLNLPPTLRPPAGLCQLPVATRFIENRAVVTAYLDPVAGPATGLKIGDVIESLDRTPVDQLVTRWTPYYPASNSAARLRDISVALTRGDCIPTRVDIRRGNEAQTISATRVSTGKLVAEFTHDRPGDTFQLLSPDVAYVKLSSVKAADAASYVDRARGTKGLIIDIRNYPSEFMVFALGQLLVDRPTPFAWFTAPDLENPGTIRWNPAPVTLTPQQPHYSGKIAILVDETTLSQAEYTTMAFRSARGAIVVGSTTAGADGNVSRIVLPGGLSTQLSGLGVFYPDGTPTQRIGIVPDVEARPTIEGVRAGRDEVLEAALREIEKLVP
jgi:hypothetical protein